MGSNLAKLDQTEPNRDKHLPNRAKQGQMRVKRLKLVIQMEIRGKLGYNGFKLD